MTHQRFDQSQHFVCDPIRIIVGEVRGEEAVDMISEQLYVLYNNYIYNVYKDGKYRLEGGA